MKLIVSLFIGCILVYTFILVVMYKYQEKIIFPGTALPQDYKLLQVPHLYEKRIDVEGAVLSALHYQQPSAKGLIFFLHGNAGNLDSWLPDVDFYQRENYDVFMLDYRGYGKSTGFIQNQEQINSDILTAWKSVAEDYQKQGLPVVVYGRSIGTYFAAQLATQVDSNLLVLVSPFSSMQSLAQKKFFWLPRVILRYPLATDQLITGVRPPLLILHGAKDKLILPSHAQQLSAMMPDSSLHIIDGAAHNDIHSFIEYEQILSGALP